MYAGDGTARTAGAYLSCVLEHIGYSVMYIPSDAVLQAAAVRDGDWRLIILSDFPKSNLPLEAEKEIESRVRRGTGFLMIGGWESFSGGPERYTAGPVAEILPVLCREEDDRWNYAPGLYPCPVGDHPAVRGLPWDTPPVICGLNRFSPRPESAPALAARPLTMEAGEARLSSEAYPLLVTGRHGAGITAALATDLAPHWAGGLVDWGGRRVRLTSSFGGDVEVGDAYLGFIRGLTEYLCGRRPGLL
jgi:hypothetical protein